MKLNHKSQKLSIVADENMPNVEAWFSSVCSSLTRLPGRTLSQQHLTEADLLLVRSVTTVDEKLLQGSRVKFVGSATIGTDHIDQQYLASEKIPFYYAPGCNAQSVTDWLMSIFARLTIDHELNWQQKTIGIVGVGNVGSTILKRLQQFDCQVLVCDPIRHSRGDLPEHIPLQQLMARSDIVCLHAPHTKNGPFPTHAMIGEAELAQLSSGSWLISAGRGPVIAHKALVSELKQRRIHAVLDVWPTEPIVPEELLTLVQLASPHVAGYSLEGKYKGTEMLAKAVSSTFDLELPGVVVLPKAFTIDAELYAQDDLELWASELVLAVYDPARDTATMNMSVEQNAISPEMFDRLRKEYPTRRELASITVKNCSAVLKTKLLKYGFSFDQ